MNRPFVRAMLLGLSVLLVMGAGPKDWVRRGNAAFERGDYLEALEWYERAEGRILDPGLAAFNKAAALYQLGDYGRAAEQYACALEDAAGPRLANGLYGLANAQVQQASGLAGPQAVELLQEAIRNYQACLNLEDHPDGPPRETFANARANLQIAEQWLARKKLEQPQDAPTKDGAPEEPQANEEEGPDGRRNDYRPGRRSRSNRLDQRKGAADPAEGPMPDHQPRSPGAGNLPTRLAGGASLEPDRALHFLEEAMQRVRRDRARALSAVIEGAGAVRDW